MRSCKVLFFLSIFCVFSGCLLSGGKHATDSLAEQKVASLAVLESDVAIVAGFKLLEDKRPEKDISYMSSVRENVSTKVLEAIEGTKIFSTIHYPAHSDDTFIIRGAIRRFSWESFDTMISYIPVMNVFNLFGLPSTRTHAEVEIYIQVIDAESNKMLFDMSEQCVKNAKYNIYNYKEGKANEELSQCFQVVLNRLRQRLHLQKKKKIIDTVKAKIPVVSQTEKAEQEVKAIAEKVKAAEETMKAAEKKMKEVEKKAEVVEKMAQKVEEKVKEAEEKLKAAEEKIDDSSQEIHEELEEEL